MHTAVQKICMLLAVAIHLFFGFSSAHALSASATNTHSTSMASAHHSEMQHEAVGDCSDTTVCSQTATADCLEHCLESAAVSTEQAILITFSVVLFILTALVVRTSLLKRRTVFHRRDWFRPLYHFETVRLLE